MESQMQEEKQQDSILEEHRQQPWNKLICLEDLANKWVVKQLAEAAAIVYRLKQNI